MNNKILLFVLTLFVVTECKLPDYINVCNGSDPNINDCIIKSVYTLMPKLIKGIPELNVPAIEPFHIKDAILKSGSGGIHFNVLLKNILVWNASSVKIFDMKSDIDNNYFEFNALVPQLQLTGNYEMDSKILALPLTGKGPFNINVTDLHSKCIGKGKRIVTNGVEHLKFTKAKLNITFGGAKVKLVNLFNGDPTLGKATNEVINDNVNMFYEVLKPSIEDGLIKLFIEVSNSITDTFEYGELFPK